MQMPNVTHPKKFRINGSIFQVVTYEPVTDSQALQIVALYVRQNPKKFKKGQSYCLYYNNEGGTFLP